MEGHIHLPDGSETWPPMGDIVAVGPKVKSRDLVPGAKVIFKSRPATALIPDTRFGGPKTWERVVKVHEDDVLCVIH